MSLEDLKRRNRELEREVREIQAEASKLRVVNNRLRMEVMKYRDWSGSETGDVVG